MELIYSAISRNQAKYLCLKQANEAGYELKYINTKAVRAPEFDEKAIAEHQKCLGWKDGAMLFGCLADMKEKE
jgi:hypothetical protein